MADVEDRKLTCYFGILNLGGVMETKDVINGNTVDYSEVICPLYSTQSYKIKTTFNKNLTFKEIGEDGEYKKSTNFANIYFPDSSNPYHGKFYQAKFRREVLWDFGDGTQKMGYSAQHSYKLPGRYKITCTFFDINRRAWTNLYCIYVVVKELIPTVLRFDEELYPNDIVKSQIFCSKIERIARIEALNSNTVREPLTINAERVFSDEQHQKSYEQIGKNYEELPNLTFKFMQRYWSFIKNTQTLYYNSDKVHSIYLTPSDTYQPRYTDIYAKFYFTPKGSIIGDEQVLEDKIDVALYQVIPYKHIDSNLTKIKILNPNQSILNFDDQEWIQIDVNQVYTQQQLPSDVVYVGRRGFCDIFYKNDFVSNPVGDNNVGTYNLLRFIYNIENNITNEFVSSPTYTNMMPLMMKTRVTSTPVQDVKIGVSADGFLRDFENTVKSWYIDPFFHNGLYKGIDVDAYVFPFIPYEESFYIEGADDLIIDINQSGYDTYNKMYYVPKDIIFNLQYSPILVPNKGNASYVNHGLPDNSDDETALQKFLTDYIIGVHPWFYRVPLVLQDYIKIRLLIRYTNTNNEGNIENNDIIIEKYNMKSSDDIVIPRQLQSYQDVDKLLDVYMAHPMFQETKNIKDAMRAYLGKGLLQQTTTSIDNFLDDTANIKTCYLKNLISILKMLGEDVTQFEDGSFDGVNDMKNFVRLLSMNHTDLVGHKVKEDYNIKVSNDARGKHVGEEIFVDDILSLNINDGQHLGKVTGVTKNSSSKALQVTIPNGVDLIVADKYTKETKIIKFYGMMKKQENQTHTSIQIRDYDPSWGWNLLLPTDNFNAINVRIRELQAKINDGRYSRTTRNKAAEEVQSLKKRKGDLISGYYRFFLLNPQRTERRIGNFIENAFISEEIENSEEWDKDWGVTHDIMMKIFMDNCFLKNNRKPGGIYNNRIIEHEVINYVTKGDIQIVKNIYNEVPHSMFVNGTPQSTYDIDGNIKITGYINGQGENILVVSTENFLIDNYATVSMIGQPFTVFVNYDGTFVKKQQTYSFTNNNANVKLTIGISGSVEYPLIDAGMIIEFTDERIEKTVSFANKIETYGKFGYYSNIERQLKCSTTKIDGLVEYSTPLFAELSFNQKAKIGNNSCTISARCTVKDLQISISKQVNVVIDSDGEIHFESDYISFSPDTASDGSPVYGSFYFNVSGNAVLGTHLLKAYSYNPETALELQNSMRVMIAEPETYSFRVTSNSNDNHFSVNGEDGFALGYYFVIESLGGKVSAPIEDVAINPVVSLKVYNNSNVCVYQNIQTIENVISDDIKDYGYVYRDIVSFKYNDDCQGIIAVDSYGGYHDLTGYELHLTIK